MFLYRHASSGSEMVASLSKYARETGLRRISVFHEPALATAFANAVTALSMRGTEP